MPSTPSEFWTVTAVTATSPVYPEQREGAHVGLQSGTTAGV